MFKEARIEEDKKLVAGVGYKDGMAHCIKVSTINSFPIPLNKDWRQLGVTILLFRIHSNYGLTNKFVWSIGIPVAVVWSWMFIPSDMDHEGVTTTRTGTGISTSNGWSEVSHITIVIGMGPHTSIINIVSINPVPCMDLLPLTMPHEAVELRELFNLH